MTLSTRRTLQNVILFAIVLVMLLTHESTVSLNTRIILTAICLGAALLIVSRRLRDAHLLVSPLDFGWLPYVLLTGVTVLLASSPRRSLEFWLWLIAVQLPLSYGLLYLFRRRWPERSLYRALLGAGGFLYTLTVVISLNYLSQFLADRAAGVTSEGFRLFGVLDHPNIFAMFIAVSMPCMLAYLFTRMGRVERIAVIAWLLVAVFALFATGSRTGLVASIVGSVIAVILSLLSHPAQPLNRFRGWAVQHRRQAVQAIAVMAVIAVAALAVAAYLQFGRRLQDNGQGRLTFYRLALDTFAAHPVAGGGPGGFVASEVRSYPIPYIKLEPHAHDMYLNTAADSGLLGVLGFAALLLSALVVCVTTWRKRPEMRPWIAGPIGGLVAFAASGVTDSPINEVGPFFVGAMLLAYVAAFLPAPERGSVSPLRKGLIVGGVIAVGVICVLTLLPYSTMWDATRPDVPPRSITTLAASSQALDKVSSYDRGDGLNALQAAYYWGKVATTSTAVPDALNHAITDFERGIPLDPGLWLHKLNLSALYAQAGRQADALRLAKDATVTASIDPVMWLNLGLLYERVGDGDDAQAAYLKSLQIESRWAQAGFWQLSEVRRKALAKYLTASDPYVAALQAGDVARLGGRTDEAVQDYEAALKLNSTPINAQYALGLIALAKGDTASAERYMQNTINDTIVELSDQYPFVGAWLTLGDIARQQKDVNSTFIHYAVAYHYLTQRGMDGYGTQGEYGYALLVYQRLGYISDYMPTLTMLDITPDDAARFEVLAQIYLSSGDVAHAADIYRHILIANPDDAVAQAGLARIMGIPQNAASATF